MENNNSQKVGVFSLTCITVAFTVTLINFGTGAQTTANLPFAKGILAIIIAFIILSLLWVFTGLIGFYTKKNAAQILRGVFGKRGAIVPSIIMCIGLIGFSVFDYWAFGSTLKNMFGGDAIFFVGTILGAFVAFLGAYKNITSYKWLTMITIPVAIIVFIAIMAATIKQSGGMEFIVNYVPAQEMPLMLAANAMVGSFVAVTTGFNDMTCHAKSRNTVIVALIAGMAAVALQFFVGQLGAIGLAIVDFTSLAACMIGPMFYLSNIFALFAQGNTNPGTTIIVSTQFNVLFRVPWKAIIVIQPAICTIGAIALYLGADISLMSAFTNFLTALFGPLLAVNICEFYLVGKRRLRDESETGSWSAASLISIAVGFIVGVLFNYVITTTLPTIIVVFVIAFVLQAILRLGCKMK
ncbi:MAG: hypothetical protein IJO79_05990 [Firmicutes bacterium]|nr:hypothetical protein [Bacillota bacterium]